MRWIRRQLSTLGLSFVGLAGASALFAIAYGLADTLVFRPVALPELHRVAVVRGLADPQRSDPVDWWSQARTVDALAYFESGQMHVDIGGSTRLTDGAAVSSRFFDVLQVKPIVGRLLQPGDFVDDEVAAAVVTETWARARFGSAGRAIGAPLKIAGRDTVVVGVIGSDVVYPIRNEIVLPLRRTPGASPIFVDRFNQDWIGRVHPEQSMDAARHELAGLLTRLAAEEGPKTGIHYGNRVSVFPLRAFLARPYQASLVALLAGSGIVLALAWINAASLLLVGALERRQDFAVRVSIGASRSRILRMLAFESVLIGLASGAAGGFIAAAIFPAAGPIFEAVAGPAAPATLRMPIDVLVATTLMSAVLGWAASAVPVLASALWNDWNLLRQRHEGRTSRRALRARRLLATAQLTAAMVLIVGAVLALRSFMGLRQRDVGFDPAGVLAVRASLQPGTAEGLLTQLHDSLGGAVAMTDRLPVAEPMGFQYVARDGRDVMTGSSSVSSAFFEVLGISIITGSTFQPGEQGVVILSATLARDLFGTTAAVGRDLRIAGDRLERRVVGVVPDVMGPTDSPSTREFYLPLAESMTRRKNMGLISLVSRCQVDCKLTGDAIESAVARVRGRVVWSRRMSHLLEEALAPAKLRAIGGMLFGLVGLTLAFTGVHALMRFIVVSRRHEMAMRLAVGASHSQVARLIFAGSARIALVAAIAGSAMMLPLTLLVRHLFVGVPVLDAQSYLIAAGILAVGTVSATVPPVLALRGLDLRHELYQVNG